MLPHITNMLFASPGSVHVVQDSRTKKHNFDPYLQHIVQPSEFDYSAAFPYVPPSADSVCSHALQLISMFLSRSTAAAEAGA